MTDKYLLIPVDFAAQALGTNSEKTHYLFLLLKAKLSGKGYIHENDFEWLSMHLAIGTQSIKKHLRKLLSWNYIGQNKEGVYYIRSWERILQKIDSKSIYGVEWNIYEIPDPQALFAGIFIGRLAHQQMLNRKKTESEPAQDQSQCASPGSTSSLIKQPVADRALVSILGISKGKANTIKHKACTAKYIRITQNWERLTPYFGNKKYTSKLSDKELNEARKKYQMSVKKSGDESHLVRHLFSEYNGKIRIAKDGKLFLRYADLITPNLTYKKGRNY